MAPEVSQEKGSYALHFYHWFLESLKSCRLLLMALPGLIDTLAQVPARRSLLCLWWWQKFLTQKYFLITTLLAWSLTLHLLLCSVKRSLYSERKYTHTYTFIFYKVSSVKVKMLKSLSPLPKIMIWILKMGFNWEWNGWWCNLWKYG